MPKVINELAFVVIFDDGDVVEIHPTIHLKEPKNVPYPYMVLIFASVFLANRYIKDNTLGEIKITVAA